jgi:uncharacterized RDD family membrane protein YckC
VEINYQSDTDATVALAIPRAAGLWRRTIAFLIDTLILGAIGCTIAALFIDPLSQIGSWGRLIGFAIGSVYFAYFEGGRPVGQSPGKRLMKIKVIHCGSMAGSLTRTEAWLRYVVIAVPMVLRGATFLYEPPGYQASNMPVSAFWEINSFITIVWVFLLGYLVVFNRRDRRSLQDFATSSMVVPLAVDDISPRPMAKWHWAVMGVGAIILLFGNMAFVNFLEQWSYRMQAPHSEPALRAISNVEGVSFNAIVMPAINAADRLAQKATILVNVHDSKLVSEAGVRKIANLALNAVPELASQALIEVVSQQQATLGIGSWTRRYVRTSTPKNWAN